MANNKYHEALETAKSALSFEIRHIENNMFPNPEFIEYRRECIARLSELQKVLFRFSELKQSLSEIELEGK
jgi:hypothetical protein